MSRRHSTRAGGTLVASHRAAHSPLLAMPTMTVVPMVARATGWRSTGNGSCIDGAVARRDGQQQSAEGRRGLADDRGAVRQHGDRQALGDVQRHGPGLVQLLAHDGLGDGQVGPEQEAVGVGAEDRAALERDVALEGGADAEHRRAPRGWGQSVGPRLRLVDPDPGLAGHRVPAVAQHLDRRHDVLVVAEHAGAVDEPGQALVAVQVEVDGGRLGQGFEQLGNGKGRRPTAPGPARPRSRSARCRWPRPSAGWPR